MPNGVMLLGETENHPVVRPSQSLNLQLLRQLQRIIDLDTQIANGAF